MTTFTPTRTLHDLPIPFAGDLAGLCPTEIRFWVDFLSLANAAWLLKVYESSASIARAFFPKASQHLLDSCIIGIVGKALWDIGYSPVYNYGEAPSFETGNPIWFCDGDPRDALRYDHFLVARTACSLP